MTADETIGQALRERRRALQISGDELASLMCSHGVGWTEITVSKVELGTRQLTFYEALVLHHHAGISIAELDRPGVTLLRNADVRPSLTERRVSATMGVPVDELRRRSRALWGCSYSEERARRRRNELAGRPVLDARGASSHIGRRMRQELEAAS